MESELLKTSFEELVGGASSIPGHLIGKAVEEIALEGLDGITFQALRIRLEQRKDVDIEDFEVIAPSLWRQLRLCKRLQFYMLPKQRQDLIPYYWHLNYDSKGRYFEPLHAPEEIYHYFPVDDKDKRVRGSCEFYHSRLDISEIVRRASYQQIIKGFGNRFVMVACQEKRDETLFGRNYRKFKGLSVVQYCIMERVGRARLSGELTRGKVSSACMNIPPKTLHYHRKFLVKSGLIKRQNVSIKFANTKVLTYAQVFHLPRFFQRRESIVSLNVRKIFHLINNSETRTISKEELVIRFSKHAYKFVVDTFPTLVKPEWELPKLLESPVSEKKKRKVKKPRAIRILRLIQPNQFLQNQVIRKVMEYTSDIPTCQEEANSDTSDSGEEINCVNTSSPNSYTGVHILRPLQSLLFSTNFFRLMQCVVRAGLGGLTQADIGNLMCCTPLESRSCARFLTRNNFSKEANAVKIYKNVAFTYRLVSFSTEASSQKIGNELHKKVAVAKKEIQKKREKLTEKKVKVTRARIKMRNSRKEKAIDADKSVETVDKVVTEIIENFFEENEEDEIMEDVPLVLIKDNEMEQTVSYCPDASLVPGELPVEIKIEPEELPRVSEHVAGILMELLPLNTPAEGDIADVKVEVENFKLPKTVLEREDREDFRIRKQMTRLRTTWNTEEDRFLLIAYVASSLFHARYSYHRIYSHNSLQIRNLMIKWNVSESAKTSTMIRRRLHFLLRNKQYYELYVEWVGIAIRDQVLYEQLIKEHMPPPRYRTYFLTPQEQLGNVVGYLMEKWKNVEMNNLKRNGKGLDGVSTILFLRQVKRVELYWKAMIFAATFYVKRTGQENRVFKREWREILKKQQKEGRTPKRMEVDQCLVYCFKLLQFLARRCVEVFRNTYLLSVLPRNRGFQLISFKELMEVMGGNLGLVLAKRECGGGREVKAWTSRGAIIEMLCGAGGDEQEVGMTEKENLEKCVRALKVAKVLVMDRRTRMYRLSKYFVKPFMEGLGKMGFDEVYELLEWLELNKGGKVDALACESFGVYAALVELMDVCSVELTLDKEVFTLEINAEGEMGPDEDGESGEEATWEVDPPEQKKKVERAGAKKGIRKRRKKEDKKVTKMAAYFAELSVRDKEKVATTTQLKNKKKRNEPKVQVGLEMGDSYLCSQKGKKNTTKLLRVRLKNWQSISISPTRTHNNQIKAAAQYNAVKIKFPRLDFCFGRKRKFKAKVNTMMVGNPEPFGLETLKKLRNALVEIVYHQVPKGDAGKVNWSKYLNRYSVLFDLIRLSGGVGISGEFLKSIFEEESLLKGLKYLLESKLVFGVGVVRRRFVSYDNVTNWLIPVCPRNNGNGQGSRPIMGHVIMRPWITAVGGVSWTTFSRLLTGLVGQLQGKVEMLLDELLQLFEPILSRVECLVLVEIFQKMEYLTLYKIKESKPTLFSDDSKRNIEIEYNVDTLLSTENVFVTSSPYVTLLHAQLQRVIQRRTNLNKTG